MTVVADTMLAFPDVLPSYGFVASPTYYTEIVQRSGGFERLNSRWSRPLLFISSSPFEVVNPSDTELILEFFHVMRGRGGYFRFRDPSDYQSAAFGVAISSVDQPLVEVVDDPGTYQLVKRYTSGGSTQDREIYKPIGSTVVVANDSAVEQDPGDWSLDEATGILTPGGGFSGTPATWGGEFDVEVRFREDALDVEIDSYGTRVVRPTMRERRREATT